MEEVRAGEPKDHSLRIAGGLGQRSLFSANFQSPNFIEDLKPGLYRICYFYLNGFVLLPSHYPLLW